MHSLMGGEAPVRWREGVPQYKCPMCDTWWDLTPEHWVPDHGMQRCKSCWREYHKLRERIVSQDEVVREVKRFKGRVRYAENREKLLAATRAWKDAHREHVRAYQRAYRARKRAERVAA